MRLPVVLFLSASLCGCFATNTVMRSQTMSFDDIIEDTTDKLLVLNILRAKDKAPLHFDEIPSIHESLTAGGSVSAVWPFGPSNKGTVRNSITAGANASLAPSFEIDNLATKDFVTGMSTPIGANFVKYWLDRGLDRRVVLLLFFSAIDVTVTEAGVSKPVTHTIRIRNSPREAIDALYTAGVTATGAPAPTVAERETNTCKGQSDFLHYLKLINNLTSFTAQSTASKKVILDSVPLDSVDLSRVIAALATQDSKASIKIDAGKNTLSLFGASSSKTALCLSRSQARAAGTAEGEDACDGADINTGARGDTEDKAERADSADAEAKGLQDIQAFPEFAGADDERVGEFCARFGRVIEQLHGPDAGDAATLTKSTDPKPQIRMEIRSVGEIIQFLGDLMAYQENLQAYRSAPKGVQARVDVAKLNPILTFGFCAYASEPHCGDVFFNVSGGLPESAEVDDYRFSVRYRGETYFVPRYSRPESWADVKSTPCSQPDSRPGSDPSCIDHTLEVLAVVNQLIDLQRSAKDVQQTPYVSVLP